MIRNIDIVAQAHVLADFLPQFVKCLVEAPDTTIKEFYYRYERRLGAEPQVGRNVAFTPGALLGILYILIVFQKEMTFDNLPSIPIDKLSPDEWGNLSAQVLEPGKDLKYLIRRMRNSLSHANVEIADDFSFIFSDKEPKELSFSFVVKMTMEDLQKFVSQLTRVVLLAGDSEGTPA
jgi:hypothetical protein